MRRLLTLLVSTILPVCAVAQTARIDALRVRYYGGATSRERQTALQALYQDYQTLPKDTLWQYAQDGLRLASETMDATATSLATAALADAYIRYEQTDSALLLIDRELLKNPVSDAATRPVYFKLAAQRVDCFGDASNYTEALGALYSIVGLAERYGDSVTLAKNMNTIGVIQYNLDHVPDAFSWYFRGLASAGTGPESETAKAAICINLAETYRWVEKTDSAELYIRQAIALCNRIQNLYYLCNALRVKAGISRGKGQFAEAEQLMLRCIALRRQTDGEVPPANELLALAGVYTHWGRYDRAIAILTDALSYRSSPASPRAAHSAHQADVLRIEYLKALAKCYGLKGDPAAQVAVLQQIIAVKDSFYQANSVRAVAELQAKYELQKKETTITKQKLDIIQKDYVLYSITIAAAFVMILILLLFWSYRRRQRVEMRQMMLEEKLSAQQAVAAAEEKERVRIAADLHDNLGAYAASIASNIDRLSDGNRTDGAVLKELHNNAHAIVSQLSDTIWVLKKDVLSLTAISDRLKVFIQRLQPSYPGILMDVEEDIHADVLLNPSHAFQLFRMLQEAVTNALKHAAATQITVMFRAHDQWQVTVADNGKGFGPGAGGGNGIASMRSRAAEAGWNISWSVAVPGGTVVAVGPTTN